MCGVSEIIEEDSAMLRRSAGFSAFGRERVCVVGIIPSRGPVYRGLNFRGKKREKKLFKPESFKIRVVSSTAIVIDLIMLTPGFGA